VGMDVLDSIYTVKESSLSRSISAENPDGSIGNGGQASSNLGKGRKGRPQITLPKGETVVLADINGPGMLRHLWFTVGEHTEHGDYILRNLVVRMYWDNEPIPSVEVPFGDFFCCGFGAKCEVNSIPVTVAPVGGFNTYWPMPFRKHAKITIENQHCEDVKGFYYSIDYSLEASIPEDAAYFHAQWRRTNVIKEGEDHVILDGVKGKGHFVGTYFALASLGRFWWGEGEFKFFIDDDSTYPTICGTGIEDYFGGAWCYWQAEDEHIDEHSIATYSTPYLGYHYYGKNHNRKVRNYSREGVPSHGLYRWHILDPIRFQKALRVTAQDIGHDDFSLFERSDDISSVAYWYQTEPHVEFPVLPSVQERRPR